MNLWIHQLLSTSYHHSCAVLCTRWHAHRTDRVDLQVTADASENQDLLEGIRGAGGALGIATELVFRLHDYSCYFGGSKLWLDPNGTLFRCAAQECREKPYVPELFIS